MVFAAIVCNSERTETSKVFTARGEIKGHSYFCAGSSVAHEADAYVLLWKENQDILLGGKGKKKHCGN